jgi:hypothetical protein
MSMEMNRSNGMIVPWKWFILLGLILEYLSLYTWCPFFAICSMQYRKPCSVFRLWKRLKSVKFFAHKSVCFIFNTGLSITWTPLHLVFWGNVFFAFQHNLGTFCRGELLKLVWISVAKIWSMSLILLFPQENHTFGISGINLCHLRAELSILSCRKLFRWVDYSC